ncbi:hypothetical protein Celaphus_00010139 [Cervus elaphus hippelaphus]|uniref:Uncharacterized protein n=1 Tax=Cervus elaphus hippelaphus TaxID=46360 RepID=A0A212C120_CEREH|nr:hypothetical protein Celaphus_00010139 [Cervus elaphus hippelaphus]
MGTWILFACLLGAAFSMPGQSEFHNAGINHLASTFDKTDSPGLDNYSGAHPSEVVPEHDKTPVHFLWLRTHGWMAAPPNHSRGVPADSPESRPAASSPHPHGASSAARGPPAANDASSWPTLHDSNPTPPAKPPSARPAALPAPVHPAAASPAPAAPAAPAALAAPAA